MVSSLRQEIDTLVGWADSGAHEGDAKDAPPPRKFVESWTIGKPDSIRPADRLVRRGG
jgi:hypothetical protein